MLTFPVRFLRDFCRADDEAHKRAFELALLRAGRQTAE
jgi:hypothetical protein